MRMRIKKINVRYKNLRTGTNVFNLLNSVKQVPIFR